MIKLPTEQDLANDEEKPYLEKYLRGKDISATERIKLFRLISDATSDLFGSRQLQYELYYAGDPVRLKMSYSQTPKKTEYIDIVRKQLEKIHFES